MICDVPICVRDGVGGGWSAGGLPPPPPPIFKWQFSGERASSSTILAKPLDFGASAGEIIRAGDPPPPERNWSRTPMGVPKNESNNSD